jgi:hypothetical protein
MCGPAGVCGGSTEQHSVVSHHHVSCQHLSFGLASRHLSIIVKCQVLCHIIVGCAGYCGAHGARVVRAACGSLLRATSWHMHMCCCACV